MQNDPINGKGRNLLKELGINIDAADNDADKIRCPYCGGQTERIKPLPEIPVLRQIEKRCVEVRK